MVADAAARFEQLRRLFAVELSDRLTTLTALASELSVRSGPEQLAAVRRELHSLKGAARAAEAPTVEQIIHAAEGALAAEPMQGQVIDALQSALALLPTAYADANADIGPIMAALAGQPRPLAAAVPPPAQLPAAVRPQEQRTEQRPARVASPEQSSVRVSLTKLDALLTESGELSVTQLRISERLNELRELQRELEGWQRDWTKTRPARARLRRTAHRGRESELMLRAAERADKHIQAIVQRTRGLVGDLAQNSSQLATVAHAIGEEVMAIRLLPAGSMFAPFERLVRDLSRQIAKEARLELDGTETELDRRILDELRDPLMHMVRNSVDHGLELPEDRVRAGKPAEGRIKLAAAQRGDRVHIMLEDDGRGLDLEAIRATALRRNLLMPERADTIDADSLIDFIFHPGFSTRAAVSEVSGRGVGMDVVRDHVSRLGGNIRVQTTPGAGTTFTISVPLTLATTRVLLVEDGGQTFAVPSSSVERTGRIRGGELHKLEGRLAIQIDGRVVPVVELSAVLQRPNAGPSTEAWRPFFILTQGERSVALLADRLIDETELVVKGLGAPLRRVRHVSGAAVLGTGAVVVILNPSDLFKSAQGSVESAPRVAAAPVAEAPSARPRRRVLVVDDSVMTRTLERTILESAGYSVVVATDGAHALELLNEAPVDAIVSDVEMPRMTGLELTAAIRQDERWRHLPVVLVTSLDSPEQVERGAAAGADAYIVKGRFDQNDLLQTVGRLL
jgi:two-component system, chemotaxis family, sensor kinase CheA